MLLVRLISLISPGDGGFLNTFEATLKFPGQGGVVSNGPVRRYSVEESNVGGECRRTGGGRGHVQHLRVPAHRGAPPGESGRAGAAGGPQPHAGRCDYNQWSRGAPRPRRGRHQRTTRPRPHAPQKASRILPMGRPGEEVCEGPAVARIVGTAHDVLEDTPALATPAS